LSGFADDWRVDAVVDVSRFVTAAAALALACVALLRVRQGGEARRWSAAAFVALAVVVLLGAPEDGTRPAALYRALVVSLLLFPYLLFRFTASFGAVRRGLVGWAASGTVAIVIATLALPSIPDHGADRPDWFTLYVAEGMLFWTALSVGSIVGLWRGAAKQPTLARRRMRLMAAATGGLNVSIALAGFRVGGDAGQLVVEALLLASVALFALGFAPPTIVRLAWQRRELLELREAIEELIGAVTVSAVTARLLPHVASIVGGSGAALCDADGTVIESIGTVPSIAGDAPVDPATAEVVPLSPPFGALVVGTSPVTPFFGREEVTALHALGALADVSLARCVAHERERATQAALIRAREEAERANLAKSEFLSRMSHELRTPLNVVLGFAQLLEMREAGAARDREPVEHILKAGRHLLELINEVLDLSRIESGRMTVSPEPVEAIGLAGEALDLIRPLAAERGIRLVADLEGEAHVTADRQRLKQVLLNLLSNAVKYNRYEGEVSVRWRATARRWLRLEVRDTGPGIAPGLMNRLFEPFERLGAERSRVEGTGLGLALSRQLVELMGGQIGAESVVGQGSTFWIEFATAPAPLDEVRPPAAETADEPDRPLARRRVLLIEDNLANLKLIEVLTADRSHVELLPAMTGRMGLELAREHRPDLILLDQHLPDVTGAEVLNRLKSHPATREIPVVIVSADATPGRVRRMRELGAADYLTKPLDVPRFLDVVDGRIERQGEPALR
jgi:signal transduction histidine kinase/CheY-like chemotaxis protein